VSEGFVVATQAGHAIELPDWSMLVKVGAELGASTSKSPGQIASRK
jgi:hypothetical protein